LWCSAAFAIWPAMYFYLLADRTTGKVVTIWRWGLRRVIAL
jgi:hypothetical protein